MKSLPRAGKAFRRAAVSFLSGDGGVMAVIVQKFGGTSVGDLERIARAASRVKGAVEAGYQVAVVVSAMAGETDRLVGFVNDTDPGHDRREYDAVVASGEQVTAGLMALALQRIGIPARSFQGWQVPILTDEIHGRARVAEVRPENLRACLDENTVPVITGFQGVTPGGRVTTLGRGGSDLSAVVLAAALGAERCDIYTDVDGVYTCDPRIVAKARKLDKITYEEMLEMASQGAKVLHTRSVATAMNHRVRLQVLSTFTGAPGTLVVDEDEIVEQQVVSGIAYSRDDAKITMVGLPDRPGVAASLFGPLSENDINVDMIVQNISEDGERTDLTFTVAKGDLSRAMRVLEDNNGTLGAAGIEPDSRVVKVSVIGVGMRSHAGVASTMFKALADKGINIQLISTSEIKISVLISEDYLELALRALHTAYGLDAAE
jgi:aspartate kinase